MVLDDPRLLPILKQFLGEAEDICARITRDMLGLESGTLQGAAREQAVSQTARGLHTLKGSAATLGLGRHSELAHLLEDRFAQLRDAAAPDRAQVDALLQGLDGFLETLRAAVRGDAAGAAAVEARVEALKGPAAEREGPLPPEEGAPAPSGAQEGWRIDDRQMTDCLSEVERLREVRLRLDDRRRQLEGLARAVQKLLPGVRSAGVRGELNVLEGLLLSDGEEVETVVESLESTLRAVSTLPVGLALEPLHRTLRDLSGPLGKEVQLAIAGAELTLDRRLLQSLQGPLAHLVRNAVDHGIERPEVREAAGKHRVGALVIRVERAGSFVFLEVSDDGAGMDPAAIRRHAERQGHLTRQQSEELTPQQVLQLTFLPGFSTREAVSELSGRGVGLDAVRREVERLGGRVELYSTPGQGTRFILSIPSEIGTSPLLVVRVGDLQLSVPMLAVENMQVVQGAELRTRGDTLLLEYREALVPVNDLGAVLGLRPPRAVVKGTPLMVIQHGGRKAAFAVDAVVGDRELTLRPLPKELQGLECYQSAGVMAEGELVLVVRPEWLARREGAAVAARASGRRVLVVDDSLAARSLHRTILEAGGYQVHTASDGRAALEHLGRGRYDAVVCDIQMEPMDGFALTEALRKSAELRDLPVVLVSAHDGTGERARGVAAGADGFLGKRECASGRLLDELSRVLARKGAAA